MIILILPDVSSIEITPQPVSSFVNSCLFSCRCRHVQLYHQLYSAFATLIVGGAYLWCCCVIAADGTRLAVLVIIRTYALYERSRKVLIFLICLMTTSWSVACVSFKGVQHRTGIYALNL